MSVISVPQAFSVLQSRRQTVLAVSVAILTAILAICYWRVQLDDSYIFYSYAENIASGVGYVFNAGERVNATTSPLYTLLLAFLYLLLNPLISMPVLGHLISAAGTFVAAIVGMALLKEERLWIAAALFPFLFLVNPLLINGVGMESLLTLALVMLSFYAYQQRQWTLVGLFCGLAVLSRPDSLLVPVLLAADYLYTRRKLPPLRGLGMFVLVLLPWLLFSLFYFGSFLPSTLSAKLVQTETERWGSGLIYLKGLFSWHVWQYSVLRLPIFATILLSAVVLAFRRQWMQRRILVLIFIWALSYLIAYGFVLNPPAYDWYYVPFAVPVSLAWALTCEALYGYARRFIDFDTYVIGIATVVAVISLVLGLRIYAGPFTDKYVNYREAAAWFNANAPEGASVAANEIGVLRYFYEKGPIIDAVGLTTPENVVPYLRRGEYDWYIDVYEPHYLMFDHPPRPILEEFVEEDWFRAIYEQATVIETDRRAVGIWRLRSR